MSIYLLILIVVLLAFIVVVVARGMARHDPPQIHHWPAQTGGDGLPDGKDPSGNPAVRQDSADH